MLRRMYIKSKTLNFRTGPGVNTGRFSESCGCSFKDGENNPYSKASHVRKRNFIYFFLKTFVSFLNHGLSLCRLTGNFIGKCQSVSIVHKTRSLPGFLPVRVSEGRLPLNQELKCCKAVATLQPSHADGTRCHECSRPMGLRGAWCCDLEPLIPRKPGLQ